MDASRPDPDTFPLNQTDAVEFNKKGLFIGGCPKSGTTLLVSLLDSHPQLVVLPEESHYLEERKTYRALTSYEDKLRYLLEKSDLKLLAMGHFEPPRDWLNCGARDYSHFDHRRFAALAKIFIEQPGMNESLLFSETVRAFAIVRGVDWKRCVRWVEKTPKTEYAEDMDVLFPDAKFIQIVRDPRAVFASRKKRLTEGPRQYTKAHRLVREWNCSAREIPRLQRDPSRFLVVRYEDLIRNPHETLEQICRFGGFDFDESMLNPTRAGHNWDGNSAFDKKFQGISDAPVEHWRNCLSEDEIWWVEFHCRKGMKLADYPFQTRAHFSLLRWLKRLPDESWLGYFRARKASVFQQLGFLKECRYDKF